MAEAQERRRASEWFTVGMFAVGAAAFTTAFLIGNIEMPAALLAVAVLVVVSEHLNVNLYFEGGACR